MKKSLANDWHGQREEMEQKVAKRQELVHGDR